MAKKKEVTNEPKYRVLVSFTERGKTRGYYAGDTFPRPDDIIGEDALKRLLGDNPYGLKYIEEV